MQETRDHTPIPVTEARRIAKEFRKSMVVLLAYDPVSNRTHTTTFGVSPEQKEIAADVGERCARLICGEGYERRTSYEDYRFIDQGKRAEQIDGLATVATAARHALLSIIACRHGMPAEELQVVADDLGNALQAAGRPA